MNQEEMVEIAFVPESKAELTPQEMTEYLGERLPEMAAIAKRLIDAGMPIEVSIRGLAFLPSWKTDENEAESHVSKEKLAALGIHEEVSFGPTCSYIDVLDADYEMNDRVEYGELNSKLLTASGDICLGCTDNIEQELSDLEERYGRRSLLIPNDYERGVLDGKLEALRWVQGWDWEERETRAFLSKAKNLVILADDLEKTRVMLEKNPDMKDQLMGLDHQHDDASTPAPPDRTQRADGARIELAKGNHESPA